MLRGLCVQWGRLTHVQMCEDCGTRPAYENVCVIFGSSFARGDAHSAHGKCRTRMKLPGKLKDWSPLLPTHLQRFAQSLSALLLIALLETQVPQVVKEGRSKEG